MSTIAFAQSYFALQTRKQELWEERLGLHARLERERLALQRAQVIAGATPSTVINDLLLAAAPPDAHGLGTIPLALGLTPPHRSGAAGASPQG